MSLLLTSVVPVASEVLINQKVIGLTPVGSTRIFLFFIFQRVHSFALFKNLYLYIFAFPIHCTVAAKTLPRVSLFTSIFAHSKESDPKSPEVTEAFGNTTVFNTLYHQNEYGQTHQFCLFEVLVVF